MSDGVDHGMKGGGLDVDVSEFLGSALSWPKVSRLQVTHLRQINWEASSGAHPKQERDLEGGVVGRCSTLDRTRI